MNEGQAIYTKKRSEMTPAELEVLRAHEREKYRLRRILDPEGCRLSEKEKTKRRKQKDIEAFKLRERQKYLRRKEKDWELYEGRSPKYLLRKANAQRAYYARHTDRARLSGKNCRQRSKLRTDPYLLMNSVTSVLTRLLPPQLPAYVRDDVTSEITLAVLEGKLQLSDVSSKCKSYLRAYDRMFDQFSTVSLDAEIPGTDGLTYGDRLAYND